MRIARKILLGQGFPNALLRFLSVYKSDVNVTCTSASEGQSIFNAINKHVIVVSACWGIFSTVTQWNTPRWDFDIKIGDKIALSLWAHTKSLKNRHSRSDERRSDETISCSRRISARSSLLFTAARYRIVFFIKAGAKADTIAARSLRIISGFSKRVEVLALSRISPRTWE